MEGVAPYAAQLASHEQVALACYEEVIARGLRTFYDVGNALAQIRDDRLYRATHATFEDYCRERWGMSRQQAYRLVDAAAVVERLSPMGDMLPTNERQVRPLTQIAPEQQPEVWQRIVETAPNGKVTAAHVEQVTQSLYPTASPPAPEPAPAAPAAQSILLSSASQEWYTPAHIIDRVVEFFGEIDLDPCSNSHEAPNVPARVVYTKEDDGLVQPWAGRVYMNPPYARDVIGPWVQKLVTAYERGTIEAGIALVPARTDTAWFWSLWRFPLCFVRGRLHFGSPDGTDNSATFPSVLACISGDVDEFARWFGDLGHIVNEH